MNTPLAASDAFPLESPAARDADREALVSYAYSYPHKSSYRTLAPPVRIADAWRDEDASRLSLYAHVPFCEMRCGFCNLFTQSRPVDEAIDDYLRTLRRQTRVVREAVPHARFAQFAIGGGTPTILSARQLDELCASIESTFGFSIRDVPTSVETSPATATNERLRVLAERGVRRVSLGVQSFVEDEARRLGRPQRGERVRDALDSIRAAGFPTLNVDLIYGDPSQTRASWRESLLAALEYEPEELYLYPLYVRPETGLARTGRGAVEHRRDLYREARDLLREHGYSQTSLRCFRLPRNDAPCTYACQRDGMIGLGCGARSYTTRLHYATRFAVTQAGVRAILGDWIAQSDERLALATHGVRLSEDEQRRRFLIMSLLQRDGLSLRDYRERFGSSPERDVPELDAIRRRGWLIESPERLALTDEGLEESDVVGPLLYSSDVRERLRRAVTP